MDTQHKDLEQWDLIVKSKSSLFDIDLYSLWKYRDLIMLFVKKALARSLLRQKTYPNIEEMKLYSIH